MRCSIKLSASRLDSKDAVLVIFFPKKANSCVSKITPSRLRNREMLNTPWYPVIRVKYSIKNLLEIAIAKTWAVYHSQRAPIVYRNKYSLFSPHFLDLLR